MDEPGVAIESTIRAQYQVVIQRPEHVQSVPVVRTYPGEESRNSREARPRTAECHVTTCERHAVQVRAMVFEDLLVSRNGSHATALPETIRAQFEEKLVLEALRSFILLNHLPTFLQSPPLKLLCQVDLRLPAGIIFRKAVRDHACHVRKEFCVALVCANEKICPVRQVVDASLVGEVIHAAQRTCNDAGNRAVFLKHGLLPRLKHVLPWLRLVRGIGGFRNYSSLRRLRHSNAERMVSRK
mmetsp:Transcript_72611/g.170161  ORF Transcript_72611/g.170161 Transcript_72611/m.170161 type:complete len:241 (+) Transcript_72611:311-1033(+)